MEGLTDALQSLGVQEHEDTATQRLLALNLGLYSAAESYYDGQNANGSDDYAVVLEFAKLLFRQARWKKCTSLIEGFIQRNPSLKAEDSKEPDLLSLIRATSAVYAKGSLKAALTEARRTRSWLKKNVNVKNHLSSVEIDLIEFTLRITKLADAWSNWVTPQDKILPSESEDALAWTGYVDLATALQEKSRWWDALRIINLVADVLSPQQGTEAYVNLISNCVSGKSMMGDKLAKISALSALSIHESKCQNYGPARHACEMADTELRNISLTIDTLKISNLGLDLEWARLKAWPHADRMVTASAAEKLGRTAQKSSSFGRADQYFTEACELSLQAYSWKEFSEWREIQEKFELHEMGDLPDLLLGRSRQWRFGRSTDRYQLVEWFDDFERTHQLELAISCDGVLYPAKSKTDLEGYTGFDVPLALYAKESALLSIFQRTKMADRESWSLQNLRKLENDIPKGSITQNLPKYLQDWKSGNIRESINVLTRQILSAPHLRNTNSALLASIVGPVHFENADSVETKAQELFEFFFAKEQLSEWPARRRAISNWLVLDQEMRSSGAAAFIVAQLQLLRSSKSSSPDEAISQNEEFVRLAGECDLEPRNFLIRNIQHSRSFIAKIKLMFVPRPEPSGVYDEIIRIHTEILDAYITHPHLRRFGQERANQYIRLADACQRKRRVQDEPPLDIIEEYLRGAETALDEHRQDMAALQSAKAIKEKSRISTIVAESLDLEKVGYRVYRLELLRRPSDRTVMVKMWNWIQRSKGRALTDALGLRMQAPASLLAKVESEEANALFLSWEKTRRKVSDALEAFRNPSKANEVYYLRKQMYDIANQMRQFDELRNIINLAQGQTIRFDELDQLFGMLKSQKGRSDGEIVLIDWFAVSDIVNQVKWYIAMVRSNSNENGQVSIEIKEVPNLAQEIHSWVSEFLSPPNQGFPTDLPSASFIELNRSQKDESSANSTHSSEQEQLADDERYAKLQKFQPVLGPLNSFKRKGDTIILCPFQVLHKIPLHALELSGAEMGPLIDDHRVLYCHSISILRQSAFAREHRSDGPSEPTDAKYAGFFPLRTGNNDSMLRRSFRDTFGENLFRDQQVQKQSFLEEANGAADLFFLGHVHDNPRQPLESHLCLYEQDLHNYNTEICKASSAATVTASEILDHVSLLKGAHVSWIGCASGTASSMASEDYLGIVPATLYAGAKSTISTLWPILQADGVEFSRLFFDEIQEDEDPAVLSMADHMRQAILKLKTRRGVSNVGAWGAYVFHGV